MSNDVPLVTTIDCFLETEFDFLVLGGGSAGTVVAARLAENPAVKIGILEAGNFLPHDPVINTPGYAGMGIGNPSYDWRFLSIPQPNLSSRPVFISRGKMIGGSGGINLMAYGRASKQEYDSLTDFSPQSGWNWNSLLPYLRKAETFQTTEGHDPFPTADLACTGDSGPISVSYNAIYPEPVKNIVQALNSMGVSTNPDPLSGDATGVVNYPFTIDRKRGVRSYSADYLKKVPHHSNISILCGAQVTKVMLEPEGTELKATGVQFYFDSKLHTVGVKREVILSAGTIQTPQILELSGVGSPEVLSKFEIPTLINLPGVGENLQEHPYVRVQWKTKPGVKTLDLRRNDPSVTAESRAQYEKDGTGLLSVQDSTMAFTPSPFIADKSRHGELVKLFDQATKTASETSPLYGTQYEHQRSWLLDERTAVAEFIVFSRGLVNTVPGESYITVLGGAMHPVSRGSIHIKSSDPLSPPEIDLRFLSNKYDQELMLDILKSVLKFEEQPSMQDILDERVVPEAKHPTEDDLRKHIRDFCNGGFHHMGTAAMSPREHGGVVDSELRVYGTKNLRVVDASVIPLNMATHPISTVYAAADMILKSLK
ncbi:alcohol oxidase [Cyathus striatus]|nr:alcohol oxidase [Cyathus striatus]